MRPELIEAIALLRRNTPESLDQAIGLLQNTVYSFSMKVCGHPQDAEDTTQEVLFRSLRHLTKIEEPQALAVWLYTVTRNRCWRMRGKVGVQGSRRNVSLEELMPNEAELAQLLQDAGESPEGSLLQAEQHQLVHQAVLRIPAPLRIVLVLHDMEELTTEQVAAILGLQPGTVRVRLHRARLHVRREIDRALEGIAAKVEKTKPTKRKLKGSEVKKEQQPAACRDLFANLSEYLDDRVAPLACEQMREHIDACPACVAFLRDLRHAIDRCRTLQVPCDSAIAPRLRSLLTQEYQRMLAMPAEGKMPSTV